MPTFRNGAAGAGARALPMLAALAVGMACPRAAQAQPSAEQPEALAQPPSGMGPERAIGSWSIRFGAGAVLGSAYPGSETLMLNPLPIVDIDYRAGLPGVDSIFLNARDGLGIVALRRGPFSLGGGVGFSLGRDQDVAARLHGLGDIDPAAVGNLFLRADFGRLGFSAKVDRAFGQQDGTTVTVGAGYRMRITPRLMMAAQVGLTWADGDHMQQWFGVTDTQARRSSLARYSAGAGFRNVTVGLNAIYRASEHWELNAGVGLSQLLGDAADSPITQQAAQPFGLVGVAYRF